MTELLGRPRRNDPLAALTGREREVLALAAEGLSNRAIATHLYVVERTVEAHVTAIFMKLGLTDSPDSTDVFWQFFPSYAADEAGGFSWVLTAMTAERSQKTESWLWGVSPSTVRAVVAIGWGRRSTRAAWPGDWPGGYRVEVYENLGAIWARRLQPVSGHGRVCRCAGERVWIAQETNMQVTATSDRLL